jgi:hypothetical protein
MVHYTKKVSSNLSEPKVHVYHTSAPVMNICYRFKQVWGFPHLA